MASLQIQTTEVSPSISLKLAKFSTGIRRRFASTSIITYVLFCFFGVGSWIAINGIWAELPVLLVTQPECFKLATALTLIFQIANLGPLTYSAIKVIWHRFNLKVLQLEVGGVFTIVTIGIISAILLGIFWDHTVHVSNNQSSSIVFYTLAFSLALVDCTSSVIFVPFMQHFPPQYLSALYIGEGLSGLIPSTVALVQGSVNNSLSCQPGHESHYSTADLGLLFSPGVFFSLLAVVMCICVLAFIGILVYPVSKRELLKDKDGSDNTSGVDSGGLDTPCSKHEEETFFNDESDKDDSPLLDEDQTKEIPPNTSSTAIMKSLPSSLSPGKFILNRSPAVHKTLYLIWRQRTPLFCITVLSFLLNGALPSISAFAFGSYGNLVLHLAVNLGLLMNPIAAFLFMVIPARSNMLIAIFTTACWLLGIYILINSFGYGVLVSGTAGGVIIILVNACMSALGSYTKVAIAVMLHSDKVAPDIALLLNGLCTQLGSLLGAVLFFNLVYFTNLF